MSGESTLARVTAHSSDRVAAFAGVHSGTLADTLLATLGVKKMGRISAATSAEVRVPGCTLSPGD